MSQADAIRQYALEHFIAPARRRGLKTVSFGASEVHTGLGLEDNRYPNVCQAIAGEKFSAEARVLLLWRDGPAQSTTTRWMFEILP